MLINPHAGAVKKYSVKNNSSISRKPERAVQEKVRDMHIIIILIDRKPARAFYAKVKDQKTK